MREKIGRLDDKKENARLQKENEKLKLEKALLQERASNMKRIAQETYQEMQEKQVCLFFHSYELCLQYVFVVFLILFLFLHCFSNLREKQR